MSQQIDGPITISSPGRRRRWSFFGNESARRETFSYCPLLPSPRSTTRRQLSLDFAKSARARLALDRGFSPASHTHMHILRQQLLLLWVLFKIKMEFFSLFPTDWEKTHTQIKMTRFNFFFYFCMRELERGTLSLTSIFHCQRCVFLSARRTSPKTFSLSIFCSGALRKISKARPPL